MLSIKRQKDVIKITLNHDVREVSIKERIFLKGIIKNGEELITEIEIPKFKLILVSNPLSGECCELDQMGYILYSVAIIASRESWHLLEKTGLAFLDKIEELENTYNLYANIFRELYPSEYMTLLD